MIVKEGGFVKDGYGLILIPLALGLIGGFIFVKYLGFVGYAATWLGLCMIFSGFMMWFFRNPPRIPPADEKNIVSGAEGTVRSVEYVDQDSLLGDGTPHPAAQIVKEFFPNQKAVRISTFLSPLHVHVNRLSIGGKVLMAEYRHGKHLLTMDERSSLYNQCSVILVENQNGLRCLHKQITGPVVRRVIFWLEKDEEVKRGQILGMMKFGSRMDIWLPADKVSVTVKPGDPVRAGETIIAKVVDENKK